MKLATYLICALPLMLCAKPVSIDEIFTPSRQFKVQTSFSYINIVRKNASLGLISIPSSIHGIPNITDSITIPMWEHQAKSNKIAKKFFYKILHNRMCHLGQHQ